MSERVKCIKMVSTSGSWGSSQCERWAVGDHGCCKQHSPEEQAKREKISNDKYEAKLRKDRPKRYASEMFEMLKGIQHLCDCQNSNVDGLSELIAKVEGSKS